MTFSIAQILRQAACDWPERTALVDVGYSAHSRREWSYTELDRKARCVAAVLRGSGVKPAQPVALIGENSAEFAAAWFGIAYAGCTVVPIPTLSAQAEVRYRIEHAACAAVICDCARRPLVLASIEAASAALPCLMLDDLDGSDEQALLRPESPGNAPAMVLYTSGTSGLAKGAAITHASLLLHTALLAERTLHITEADRILAVLPLTHSFGCRTALLVSVFAGARCVLMPRFDATRSFELLHAENITWLPAVPTMYAGWAALEATRPPPSLRWALSAGAPLPDAVALKAERCLGVELRQAYGMTEATICTVNAPPDARVLGSVGRPVYGIELRLQGDDGRDVPAGESGEVLVRGHNAMSHYLHDPGATSEASRGGFIRSGDVGRIDSAGRLAIVDRIKDLIIRGGYNVYPSEVEGALALHPEVAQVAVVGRPDAYYGEEVVAIIVRRPGSNLDAVAVAQFAQSQLGRTKQPREVAFVDALPLGPSGKVLKRVLRDQLQRGDFRLESAAAHPMRPPSAQ